MRARVMKASTTSSALAEGALAPGDLVAPLPTLPDGVRARRGRVLRPVRWLLGRKTWKLTLLVLFVAFSTTASVVYFGPVSLGSTTPLQNAVLTDVEGNFLAELRPEQNRVVVDLAQIPKTVQNSFIAAEDERFWAHAGIDPVAIGRAVFANARGDREGASTITQQYVRGAVVGVGRQKSVWRKIREAVASIRIDRKYSKEQILEGYLNSIYLGNGAYGVQAAAKLYFGRDVQDVSLEQAALLAGVTASPARFDPRRYPERARERRDYVLGRMATLGYITPVERDAAKSFGVELVAPVKVEAKAPGFVDWTRGLLKKEFGEDALYRAGLRVRTTIDGDVQRSAEQAVAEILDRPGDPEAAVVVVDVATGGVRAMVGGRGKRLGDLNLATQAKRQAGSAFKPFVLATALEQGKTLQDRYRAPGSISLRLPHGEVWRVANYDRRGRGRLTLERALAYSVNTVYAQLIRDVEPEFVAELARNAGVQSRLRPVHSLALGTSEVSPLDLATGYATLAREGEFLRTTGLALVEDRRGALLYRNEKAGDRRGRQAVDPGAANDTIAAMKTVVRIGTGRKARLDGVTTWGKTGTTEDFADAWWCGGAGGAVGCVWVGHPEGRVPMRNVHGREVVGSSFPLEIWKRVMGTVLEKYKPVDDAGELKPRSSPRPRPTQNRDSIRPSAEPTDEPPEEPDDDNPGILPTLLGEPAPKPRD